MAGRPWARLRSSRLRLACGVCAGLIVTTVLSPPVEALALRTVLLHTAREVAVLFVAAPLAAYALSHVGRRFASPVVGLLASNFVLMAWQLPSVLKITVANRLVDEAAVLVFMAVAFAFWAPLFSRDRALSQIGRCGYLLVAGVPPTLPAVVLGFSRRLYYSSSIQGPTVFDLSPLKDQHLAGLLLFGSAKLVLVTAVFVVVWNMLKGEREPPDDRRGYEENPALPPSTPGWYLRLEDDLPGEPVGIPSDQRPRVGPAGVGHRIDSLVG